MIEIASVPEAIKYLSDTANALNEAYDWLADCDRNHAELKTSLMKKQAAERHALSTKPGPKLTIQDKDDLCRIKLADDEYVYEIAVVALNAAKRNVERLKVQADIGRTLSTLIRTAVELV